MDTCVSQHLHLIHVSCCSASLLHFFSGLDKHLHCLSLTVHFLSQVMSAVWSCDLVQHLIPTELHTAFSHSTPGRERRGSKELKMCSIVMHLLPVSEDSSQY